MLVDYFQFFILTLLKYLFSGHSDEYLLSDMLITHSMISDSVCKLNTLKACTLVGIYSINLKRCAPELTDVLSKLYNICHAASCFPAHWNSSFVLSVFNNPDEQFDPSKYQTITIVLFFLLQALTNSGLVNHLISQGLLSDEKYRFRFSS